MGRISDRRAVVRIDVGPSGGLEAGLEAGLDAGASPGRDTAGVAGGDPLGGAGANTGGALGRGAGGAAATMAPATAVRRMDTLAGEEPLEIRVGGPGRAHRSLAVTMRTPGHDVDLALGFLFTEGLIGAAADVVTARLCAGGDEPNTYNVVDVTLGADVPAPATDPARHFYTTSSCGVCGKASVEAVRTRSQFDLTADEVVVASQTLVELPPRLLAAQPTFERTGGLHAAGLFTSAGELVCVREDVGRHNAVDKVVGWALRAGRLPAVGQILLVSGRASFELVQKATMAGIPVLAAVSAPSTLAVDLAESAGLTLVGFLRGATMNVYAGVARVGGAATAS